MPENNEKINEENNKQANERTKDKILIIDNDEEYTKKVRRSVGNTYDIFA